MVPNPILSYDVFSDLHPLFLTCWFASERNHYDTLARIDATFSALRPG
jgi:hypothetical protein